MRQTDLSHLSANRTYGRDATAVKA